MSQTLQAPTHTSQDTAYNTKQRLNRKEAADIVDDPDYNGDFSDCGQADRTVPDN